MAIVKKQKSQETREMTRTEKLESYKKIVSDDYRKFNKLPWDEIIKDREMHAEVIISYVSALYERKRLISDFLADTRAVEFFGVTFNDVSLESAMHELEAIEFEINMYEPEAQYAFEILDEAKQPKGKTQEQE